MTSLPPPIQAVVALFRGPLAGVRFADVDATVLTSLAAEVEAASSEIEAQEAKLGELRQAMAQRQETLLGMAQQALAYARIYAESDDELSAELAQITLPRAAKPRRATKAASAEVAATGSTSAEPEPEADIRAEDPSVADDPEIEAAPNADANSKPRLVSKPKKRYSRVPPQTRAS